MSNIKVGYWAIRGLVEPIHMYLEYKEVPYEKTAYTTETASDWLEKDKKELGIFFPNLPYLIDGDVKLSQSNTILRYLEKKFGNYYTGDVGDDMKLDILLESVTDIRTPFALMCYGPGEMDEKKKIYVSPWILQKWEYFDTWLQSSKYLTGDDLCVADFTFWNLVDYNDLFDPAILENYKNIQRFKKDFESEPKVEAYLKSPNYKKFPVNGFMASWGGQSE